MKASTVMQIILLQKPNRKSARKQRLRASSSKKIRALVQWRHWCVAGRREMYSKEISQIQYPTRWVYYRSKIRGPQITWESSKCAAIRISRRSNGGVLKLNDLIKTTSNEGECIKKSTGVSGLDAYACRDDSAHHSNLLRTAFVVLLLTLVVVLLPPSELYVNWNANCI